VPPGWYWVLIDTIYSVHMSAACVLLRTPRRMLRTTTRVRVCVRGEVGREIRSEFCGGNTYGMKE